MNREYNILQKQIRAKVIKAHLAATGQTQCVCFTCGNSSKYLKAEGLDVVEVLNPDRWWTFAEIQAKYKMFDATSGHLPMPLISEIAEILNKAVGTIPHDTEIACGSGETFLCLKMAFPFTKLRPVYNLDRPTQFNPEAPLNDLVDALKCNQLPIKTRFATVVGRESLGKVRIITIAEGAALVEFKGSPPFAVPEIDLVFESPTVKC